MPVGMLYAIPLPLVSYSRTSIPHKVNLTDVVHRTEELQ